MKCLSTIRNPLVSSDQMKKRMEGRKMVRIRSLSSKVKNGDMEGDWVTIGVVVDKLPPRLEQSYAQCRHM